MMVRADSSNENVSQSGARRGNFEGLNQEELVLRTSSGSPRKNYVKWLSETSSSKTQTGANPESTKCRWGPASAHTPGAFSKLRL